MSHEEFSTLDMELPRRRHRGMPIVVGVVALLLALVGAGTWFMGPGEADLFDPVIAAPVELGPTVLGAEPIVLDEIPDALPDEIPLDDQNQSAVDVCQMARPHTVRMLGTKASITIHNCGGKQVDWTAHSTKTWAVLTETAGTLAAGDSHRLHFTVNTNGLPTGKFTFKIKVAQGGVQTFVDVSGTKLGGLVAPQPSPTIGGITTGGPTGCAAKCITKAWLKANIGTANLTLEVKTTTLARIVAVVDTNAPKHSLAGDPYFSSPDVQADSGIERTQWTTQLKPLKADTDYHIIVAARDSEGAVSYQTGTFKTIKVVDDLAAAEPGGCSSNCVKNAVLTPTPGKARADIKVETYVPVKMSVFADGEKVADSGGQRVTQWQTTLELEHDRTYEIKLEVVDEQGNRQVHQAGVTTPPAPAASHQNNVAIRIAKIFVSDDGDNSTLNWQGELQFRVEINGVRIPELEVGERKVDAAETLDVQQVAIMNNSPDILTIRVQGWERDGGGGTKFCAGGTPLHSETSGREEIDGCGEFEWNTAELDVDLHGSTGGGALPSCFNFDAIGDMCIPFDTRNDEDPAFVVMLVVTFLD